MWGVNTRSGKTHENKQAKESDMQETIKALEVSIRDLRKTASYRVNGMMPRIEMVLAAEARVKSAIEAVEVELPREEIEQLKSMTNSVIEFLRPKVTYESLKQMEASFVEAVEGVRDVSRYRSSTGILPKEGLIDSAVKKVSFALEGLRSGLKADLGSAHQLNLEMTELGEFVAAIKSRYEQANVPTIK